MNVIKSGEVEIKKPFKTDYFSEDDGITVVDVNPGTYEFRVLDVNGWKPRQLKISGEWFDVMNRCEELENVLSKTDETTTVGNIAPTVDYLGHGNINMPVAAPVYPDEWMDKKEKEKEEDEPKDQSWVSPIGRILAGESVRKVIGGQFGITEDVQKDPALLKNLDAFKKIKNVKGILNYPGELVVRTAYPTKNTFGMRLEDPDLTKYFGPISKDNFSNPGIIVDIILDLNDPDFQDDLKKLDADFDGFIENPDWYHLKDYLRNLSNSFASLKQCTVHQR